MKTKGYIAISVAMLLLAGCTQENDEKQPVTGKIPLQEKFKDVLKTLDESVEKSKDEKADKEKADNETETESVSSENVSSSNDTSSKSKSNAEQNSSSQSTQSKSNGENNQQSSPQAPPKPAEPESPQPEPKPEPKPSVPVCDDTIPAGAYPISREDEITSQIEAEMIKNLNEGKPTFEQYSIEYGVTECGTEYFYIIKK